MSGARSRAIEQFEPPKYHWQGFGSQSTKPTWFDPNRWDNGRKPIDLWEGDACGCPKIVKKKLGKKAPYNHSDDNRIYRPEVSAQKFGTTMIPASKPNRQIVSRDHSGSEGKDLHGNMLETGTISKYKLYTNESAHSRSNFHRIKQKNVYTDMKGIIFAPQNMESLLPFQRTRSDFACGKPGS